MLETSKTDPVLKYIAGLSEGDQQKLSRESREIQQEQQELIRLLEQGAELDKGPCVNSIQSIPG